MIAAAALAAGLSMPAAAQPGYIPSEDNLLSRKQFEESRFGIFIHWGIYSMLGRGEWVMQNEDIDYREYPHLAAGFCPSRFDAAEWAQLFRESGARYVTFTTRHHDGFSMFNSKASEYNILKATPFRRDILAELADALGREGLQLHLYYSHLDWGRTDYCPLGRTGTGTGRPEGKDGDWEHYMEFINAQLTELLTGYGKIGAVWFDGVWDKDAFPREDQPAIWNLSEQYELIHRLQPQCLIGNNHHLLPFEGEDIQIFERDLPGQNEYGLSGQEISRLPLETCQTMNRSWGYRIKDTDYKSADFLIEYLVRTAAKGANLLLNIGPRPDGTIPEEAASRLREIGKWLKVNGESIYRTQAGEYSGEWGVSTANGKTTYLHILDPERGELTLEDNGRKLTGATMLEDGREVKFKKGKGRFTLQIPSGPGPDRVVKLSFR